MGAGEGGIEGDVDIGVIGVGTHSTLELVALKESSANIQTGMIRLQILSLQIVPMLPDGGM